MKRPQVIHAALSGVLVLVTQLAASDSPIRQGPRAMSPGSLGVGRRIPDLAFTDVNGHRGSLSDFSNKQAIVLAMTGTGCPLCKKYAPTLANLERRYQERGVAFLFLNPNESEELSRLRDEIGEQGFTGPYIRDDEESFTKTLGVKTTTEVFVLDRARTLVYRGAVDDQYGFGYALAAARNEYLVDALDAVLENRSPTVEATSSPGCEMFYQSDESELPADDVTYHNRISRIIQRNCLECHRDSGVAPMPLQNYEQVRDYAGMIRSVVDRRVMPPWFAAPSRVASGETNSKSTATHATGEAHPLLWANERSLAESERVDLMNWVEAGAPEGDAADAPLPVSYPDGWLIGEPDATFEFAEAISIKATGILPYKNITVETNLEEDKWVQAIEIVPGDRSVVHHALVFVLPPSDDGGGRRRDGIDYWAIYVPGNSTQVYPEGYARRLPKGARLRFQMHYTTNGRATEDRTKIGLVFADSPPTHEVKTANITNTKFQIPARASNYRVEASVDLPSDVQVLGYLPHHHLRGSACRYELRTPEGEDELLLDVPRYDFNWQLFYQYGEPRLIPQGSKITFTAWYDNSEANPANPDPTRTVGWGQQTDDEMHIGYIEYVVPAEQSAAENGPQNLLERLDVDGDGELTKAEVRERLPTQANSALRVFDRLDRNADGKLDPSEAAPLRSRK